MPTMTWTDYMRARLLAWADVGPLVDGVRQVEAPVVWPDLEQLKQTQWSSEFESFMRARLILGGGRYGWIGAPGKCSYSRLDAIIARAQKYQEIGNDELLVDIANIALLEFVEGTHPDKHFKALDADQDLHVKEGT